MGMYRDSLLRKLRGAEGKHAANNALKYGLAFIFFTTLLLACDPPAGPQPQPQPQPTVEPPTFSPAGADPGASPVAVLTTDSLAISSETDGASIRYTLGLTPPADGTDTLAAPTATTGTQYSTSQTFAALADDLSGEYPKNITIKAIAVLNGRSSTLGTTTFKVGDTVAMPMFTPNGGEVESTGSMTIKTMTEGATFHYTVGTPTHSPADPTPSNSRARSGTADPEGGTLLRVGFNTISGETDGTYIIKAIAVKDGYNNSPLETSATFTITHSTTVQVPTFSLLPDERDIPEGRVVLTTDRLAIRTTTLGANIRYTLGFTPPPGGTDTLVAPTATTGREYTTQTFTDLVSGLSGEYPDFKNITIKVIATKEGLDSASASAEFIVSYPVATMPTFTPASGDVSTTQTLTMSTSPTDATIKYVVYATGDTAPDDPTYSTGLTYENTPLNIDGLVIGSTYPKSITIKAIAFKTDSHSISPVGSANFRVLEPLTVPTFAPPETITRDGQLTINAPDGATVRYIAGTSAAPPDDPTTDPETDTSSTLYDSDNKPTFASLLPAGGTLVIKARAFMADRYPSEVVTAEYEVPYRQLMPPTFSHTGGDVLSTATLTISTTTEDATIYYTFGSSGSTVPEPSASSPGSGSSGTSMATLSFGSSGIGGSMGSSHIIRAIATKAGYRDSEIRMAEFTVDRDVDIDNDGLIEINNLDMLNNIRNNLAGTSLKTSGSDPEYFFGAPTAAQAMETGYMCAGRTPPPPNNLCGYELTQDLDFTTPGHYASGEINTAWRPTDSGGAVITDTAMINTARNAGFPGFGADRIVGSGTLTGGGFGGIFEGNGHTINNLYTRNLLSTGGVRWYVALFRTVHGSAIIRNIGVTNVHVYGANGDDRAAGLVGGNFGATIIASHASGTVDGGPGSNRVGGLVADNGTGSIIASHANVAVSAGAGTENNLGGLVGIMGTGTITASYATGNVNGAGTQNDRAGGLIGYNGGTVTASYATGMVNGGGGNTDYAGGLAGYNGRIIAASYATGDPNGGAGTDDHVGGLVGHNEGRITASYATGDPNGGDGTGDRVGLLAGRVFGIYGVITESYAFGTSSNGETDGHDGSAKPSGVTTNPQPLQVESSATTATYAGASWNNASTSFTIGTITLVFGTLGAWNFGTTEQDPALVYADYDGTSSGIDYCSMYPATLLGTSTTLTCGSTLLPGQGR